MLFNRTLQHIAQKYIIHSTIEHSIQYSRTRYQNLLYFRTNSK
uniref:Uncharacterized protein n=1 Tax=Arundo donax TaxID=35708 RepID=A0A0A9CCY6_ARUDO